MLGLRRISDLLRSFSIRTAPTHLRRFHLTNPIARRNGNVLARYAARTGLPIYPVLPQVIADIAPTVSNPAGAAFETSATAPVGTSLQETPPPGSKASTKLAVQLPAMVPLAPEPATKSVPQAEREMRVEGVLIPQKPVPPGEEECCMSGCVHCVYTIYADDLEAYTSSLSEAREALVKAGRQTSDWPEVIRKMEDEGESAGQVKREAKAEVVSGMDPTMAAFFALENRLKKQQAPDSSAAT